MKDLAIDEDYPDIVRNRSVLPPVIPPVGFRDWEGGASPTISGAILLVLKDYIHSPLNDY